MSDRRATSNHASRSRFAGARRRLWRVLRLGAAVALVMLVMMTGVSIAVGRFARPGAARRGARVLHAGRRPRRPAAAALHHAGGPLAAAGDTRGRRSALPGDAVRLRGPALPAATTASIRWRSAARFSQLVVNGRIVSGASTLTMQVARLLEPRSERSFIAKLRQMVRAIQLERTLSKDEILALYFSLAPYGGNLEGIRAASLAYFGKEPRRLTLAESALLVALPQSPEVRRPDRSVAAARAARDRVLDRLAAAGVVPADEIERAKQETVAEGRRPMPALAPHSADAVDRRGARPRHPPADDPGAAAEVARRPGARTRAHARSGALGRHSRGRQRDRRGARARRVVGLFRHEPRRAGRHDAGAALAGLGAQAVHLRARLRGRADPSRDADRRPPDPLRQLRAGEFRPELPGHGDGAPRAAALAQRAGGRGARSRRRQPLHRAAWRRPAARWCCRAAKRRDWRWASAASA